jgi:hypothetical protein
MSDGPLHDTLAAEGRPIRRAAIAAGALPILAMVLLAFATVAWFARWERGSLPTLVLGAWAALLLGGGLAARRARQAGRAWAADGVARRLETTGAARRGALTALLESAVAGTSPVLHEAARTEAIAQVVRSGPAALAQDAARWRRRARVAAAGTAVAVVALLAARPLDGTVAMLWQPWQAWSALTAPVRLLTTTPAVDRGTSAQLDIRAWGQRRAILRTRAPGEAWVEQEIALDATGTARVTTAPLQADLVAEVTAGGRTSAALRIAVRLPAFLGSLTLTATYPAYLGLEPEVLAIDGDTLLLPDGTRLDLAGRATAALASARLASDGVTMPLQVDSAAFAGGFRPDRDGDWRLELAVVGGAPLEGPPVRFAVRVVPDSAPTVEVPVPGRDTVAPPSLRVPLVVAMRDDHAVQSAYLELRQRGDEAAVRQALDLPGGPGDQALVSLALDLSPFRLAPGDSVWVTAVAVDNAPAPRTGRSRTFVIRVPTAAEVREERREQTGATATGLDSLAAAARQAQRQTEDLARERARTDPRRAGGEGSEPLAAESARRAEQAVEAQEALTAQAEALREQLEELRAAAEQGGGADSALAADLAEIRDLLERAMTPELREKLEAVREAAQRLDADRTREALRDLAQEQAKMRETLERAKELFARAALETELATLAEAARDLAEAQQAAAEELAATPEAGAAREEQLAREAEALAKALEESAAKAPSEPTEAGLQAAADKARTAGKEMQEAATAAKQGQQQRAQQKAKDAGDQLQSLEQQIRTEREEMQSAMRAEVTEALDRLLLETSRLLDRQLVVAEAYRRGAFAGTVRTEQALLEEGVARLFQQVLTTASKNALVSPRIATAVATARQGMRGALEATATAMPNLGTAAEQAGGAVDALTVAAHALLRSKDNVDGSASGSGMQEAMQQMQEMAGQQGQLAQQGQGMMDEGGEGSMQQMLQLAMQQRAIAQQLERMQAGGQMPGAGELAREAKEISRSLESGRLSPETAERQERLFRRMLDAGRSLEGDAPDERKERQSEAAREAERRLPPALEARLRRGEGDVPLPSWELLQQLRPEDRRRVLDYFRRLAVGGG